ISTGVKSRVPLGIEGRCTDIVYLYRIWCKNNKNAIPSLPYPFLLSDCKLKMLIFSPIPSPNQSSLLLEIVLIKNCILITKIVYES
ncbi:MAG: hypothetical protein Q8910_20580, partial [Bacteroidota bacterium]|nr:hypothetical protein [Bacteroidota bacterium]